MIDTNLYGSKFIFQTCKKLMIYCFSYGFLFFGHSSKYFYVMRMIFGSWLVALDGRFPRRKIMRQCVFRDGVYSDWYLVVYY